MAKRVLIIDDSATQLNSLKIFFRRDGWDVDTASDGLEAYIKVYNNPPDVIVSDVLMPNLSGFQLCRLLKSDPQTSQIPIALLTVLDKKIDKFWAMHSGADKFIMKNADFSQIIKDVTELSQKFSVSQKCKDAIKMTEISEDGIVALTNKILDEALMNATLTNEFRSIADYTSDDKGLAKRIFEILSAIVEYDVAGLYFESSDKSVKKKILLDAPNISLCEQDMKKISDKLFEGGDKETELISDTNTGRQPCSLDNMASYTDFSFEYQDYLTGKVCFYSKEEIVWEQLKYVNTLKSELDLFFKLKFLYDVTQFLSSIDDLTGLYTRRHLDETLSQEYERAKRYHSKVSIAMADIDNFKSINDTYGHQAGDVILKGVASLFKEGLRKTDFIYRYGGEEICVIMPETSLANTAIPLERVRSAIENFSFEYNGEKIPVTISIGAATYSASLSNYFEFVEAADKALYEAKHTGKNKVVLADE